MFKSTRTSALEANLINSLSTRLFSSNKILRHLNPSKTPWFRCHRPPITVRAVCIAKKVQIRTSESVNCQWQDLVRQCTVKLLMWTTWSRSALRSFRTILCIRKLSSYAVHPIWRKVCSMRPSKIVMTWWNWIQRMLAPITCAVVLMKNKVALMNQSRTIIGCLSWTQTTWMLPTLEEPARTKGVTSPRQSKTTL